MFRRLIIVLIGYALVTCAFFYVVSLLNFKNVFIHLLSFLLGFLIFAFFITKEITKIIKDSQIKERDNLEKISHELKTFLTIIISNLDTIEKNKEQLVKNQTKWMNNIKNQTTGMKYLINELLTEDVENYGNQNLSRILEKSILSLEQYAYENRVRINYNIEPKVEMKCLKNDLEKLFNILLDNAIKYNVLNGFVNIILKQSDRKITFNIRNSGHGIESKHLNKIFNKFYRGNDEMNGFGLGLFIAKAIIDNYKGNIIVKSEIDKETEFEIVFYKNKKIG